MVLSQENIELIKDVIVKEVAKSFEVQGHKMAGALINNIQWVTTESTDKILMQMLMQMYGIYLDRGVKAENIPYTPPSGRGGKSKYIEGLIRYVEKRIGLSGREAKSVAFAIANVQKKQGMPTRGSYRFSKNGKRTGFFTDSVTAKESVIESLMKKTFERIFIGRIENKITTMVRKFNSTT